MTEADSMSRDLYEVSIPGYAERYATLAAKETDPLRIAQELESQAHNERLPLPAGRGLPKPFQLLVDFLRRRRLAEDVGVRTVTLTWLSLHVPPGGSGALKWEVAGTNASQFSLSVFGSGYGRGRKISWALESEVPTRQTCMRFVQNVDLHVRVYTLPSEVRERYEVSVDVVAFRGRQLVAWPDCPFCGVEIDKIDDFEFVRGEPLDLRTYDTPYEETLYLELSGESSVEAGVNIPGLPGIVEGGKTGLSVRREASISCNVMYEFANGRVYQPYWELSDSQSLQYWGVE